MARTGLTKAQVRAVRDQLLAQGRHPSADAVRHALGDTGSKSTIHKYLKELAAEDPGVAMRRDDTVGELHALVEQLADRLHAEAEQRVRALLAEHERALRARDDELAALRATVAALEARLNGIGGSASLAPERERTVRHARRAIGGFGNFGGLLADSRSGQRDVSPFTIVLAGGRSDVLDTGGTEPRRRAN